MTRRTTRGYECAEFARDIVGEPLLPWQETAVQRALELNPDGTYRFRVVVILVARRSGKSHLLKVVNLWRMYCDGVRLVVGAAQDLGLAREVWNETVQTAEAVPELADEIRFTRDGKPAVTSNGKEEFALTNGARYVTRAATRGAGRGLGVGQLVLDEVREWRSWDSWNALAPTTMAERNGMIWALSNAGDEQSVVLNRLRESALAGNDPSVCLLEWSAADCCELDDEDAWCAANPGLGHVTNEQAMRTALATMPPAAFRTEHLCQQVSQLDEAVDLAAWSDCSDPAATMDAHRARVCLGVDVAPDGEHVSVVAAVQPLSGPLRLEVVAAYTDTRTARAELPALLQRVNPRTVAWYPTGPAAALATVLRSGSATELAGAKVAEACMAFADLVAARRIVHNGDPLLGAQLTGAARLNTGDGWRFSRKGGVGHVDCAYAAAAAAWAAANLPTAQPLIGSAA